MPTLTINGKEVTVPKGTPIIRAAAMVGANIPHFCYHPALSAPANCRMCLVEVERARKLEPACYLKCTEGMVVHTESEKVKTARQAVLEFILVNHPVDCPICDQAGECKLQDYYMAYDAKPSRLRTEKVGKVKAYPIGPHVVYDGERCILCTRCVRFCDEITGTSELTVAERGDHSEIRTFPGAELDNPYSMNVTDICPVGALTTRDFRFKARVWLLSSTDSICVGCAKGCNVHLEHLNGEAQRYRPRFNPAVNEYWMCDEGRLSYGDVNKKRLFEVRIGDEAGWSWPRAAREFGKVLAEVKDRVSADEIGFVVSAQTSVEGLYAAREYANNVLGAGHFYWAGAADGDSDEFLRVADKNPNRNGIRAVFGDDILTQDAFKLLADLEAGKLKVLFMMGTTTQLESNDRLAELAGELELFIVQAVHSNEISDAADVTFPACSHAEQSGTYVNVDGVVQEAFAAFPPRERSLPDWEIFVRLAHGANLPLAKTDIDGIRAELYEGAAEAGE